MKRLRLAILAACVSFAAIASAEELRLKTRIINPELENPAALKLRTAAANPRSMKGGRWHWLVQFESESPDFGVWEQRGAKVLSSVPVNGFIIAAPQEMPWEGLDFKYRTVIEASDKMSPQIVMAKELRAVGVTGEANAGAIQHLVVIHFHKDVESWEADGILDAEGVTALKNGSLSPEDRLAELTAAQMAVIALWDEVEYVFPAPQGLKDGEVYMSCGGVLSAGYEVAMLAASFGEGWDGPGRGQANISYSFGGLGTRTDPGQTKAEVRRALNEWSRVVAVNFTETAVRNSSRNIDVLFATGAHGDPFPFQSGSTVLGHSFYPATPNPEPLAGDIHINDAWGWSIGGQWDVFSVVLHEIGHSLGIGHTDVPGSVMYPYYQKSESLKQPDMDSIRQLYAEARPGGAAPLSIAITNPAEGSRVSAVTVNVSGTIVSGAAGLRIGYLNETTNQKGNCLINSVNTTYSCPAIGLNAGANRLRIEATLNTATASAVMNLNLDSGTYIQVRISSPSSNGQSTSASEIRLAGTASHAGGIASVQWSTNRSRSGSAAGLESWSALIPLESGSNEITIRANSRTGVSATSKITIERASPAAPQPPANPGGDTVPPRMTIQQPIGNFIITSASRLTFRGTASDNVAVRQVTWTNSAGDQSGAAVANNMSSSTSWSFDVNIAVGFNAIQVRAWDASGNSTLYSTTVRRY
jgi:hypothetical protein